MRGFGKYVFNLLCAGFVLLAFCAPADAQWLVPINTAACGVRKFTLNFNLNGGNGTTPAPITNQPHCGAYWLPTCSNCSRGGQVFRGWSASASSISGQRWIEFANGSFGMDGSGCFVGNSNGDDNNFRRCRLENCFNPSNIPDPVGCINDCARGHGGFKATCGYFDPPQHCNVYPEHECHHDYTYHAIYGPMDKDQLECEEKGGTWNPITEECEYEDDICPFKYFGRGPPQCEKCPMSNGITETIFYEQSRIQQIYNEYGTNVDMFMDVYTGLASRVPRTSENFCAMQYGDNQLARYWASRHGLWKAHNWFLYGLSSLCFYSTIDPEGRSASPFEYAGDSFNGLKDLCQKHFVACDEDYYLSGNIPSDLQNLHVVNHYCRQCPNGSSNKDACKFGDGNYYYNMDMTKMSVLPYDSKGTPNPAFNKGHLSDFLNGLGGSGNGTCFHTRTSCDCINGGEWDPVAAICRKPIKCEPGKYVPKGKTGCKSCNSSKHYCPGGTFWVPHDTDQGRYDCPAKYDKAQDYNLKSINECKIKCYGGTHILNSGDIECSRCPIATFRLDRGKPSNWVPGNIPGDTDDRVFNLVGYNSISVCLNCSSLANSSSSSLPLDQRDKKAHDIIGGNSGVYNNSTSGGYWTKSTMPPNYPGQYGYTGASWPGHCFFRAQTRAKPVECDAIAPRTKRFSVNTIMGSSARGIWGVGTAYYNLRPVNGGFLAGIETMSANDNKCPTCQHECRLCSTLGSPSGAGCANGDWNSTIPGTGVSGCFGNDIECWEKTCEPKQEKCNCERVECCEQIKCDEQYMDDEEYAKACKDGGGFITICDEESKECKEHGYLVFCEEEDCIDKGDYNKDSFVRNVYGDDCYYDVDKDVWMYMDCDDVNNKCPNTLCRYLPTMDLPAECSTIAYMGGERQFGILPAWNEPCLFTTTANAGHGNTNPYIEGSTVGGSATPTCPACTGMSYATANNTLTSACTPCPTPWIDMMYNNDRTSADNCLAIIPAGVFRGRLTAGGTLATHNMSASTDRAGPGGITAPGAGTDTSRVYGATFSQKHAIRVNMTSASTVASGNLFLLDSSNNIIPQIKSFDGSGDCGEAICTCPDGYLNGGGAGASLSDCYAACTAGSGIGTAGAACQCVGPNHWVAEHNVNWGGISSPTACSANTKTSGCGPSDLTNPGRGAGSSNDCRPLKSFRHSNDNGNGVILRDVKMSDTYGDNLGLIRTMGTSPYYGVLQSGTGGLTLNIDNKIYHLTPNRHADCLNDSQWCQ